MKDTNNTTLGEIVKRLTTEFHPEKIYLFGSRARLDHRPDSDYDLLVVVKDSKLGHLARMQRARESLKGLGISADIFIYTTAEFDDWKNELSSIPETALHEGLELNLG